MTPSDVVQKQVEAYNARDIEAFLAVYADDAEIVKDGAVLYQGKPILRERYGKLFRENQNLHCVVTRRETDGLSVTDDELVTGLGTGDVRARMRYELEDGLIQRVIVLARSGS